MKKGNGKRILSVLLVLLLVLSNFTGLEGIMQVYAGDGTNGAPYTVAEGITNQGKTAQYIEGYIVGQPTGATAVLTSGFAGDTAIAIADNASETDNTKMLYVQLPTTPASLRATYGLKTNPGVIGTKIIVKGDLAIYFTPHAGIKNTTEITTVTTDTVADNDAPVIDHTPVTTGTAGCVIPITAAIKDSSLPVAAAVYYGDSADGTGFTDYVEMITDDNTNYSAEIPAHSEGSVYYYIQATDSSDTVNTATSPSNISSCNQITVSATDTTAPVIIHTAVTSGIQTVDINITATITDDSAVTADVHYGTTADGSKFTDIVSMVNTSGDSYTATIANPTAGDLYYYIEAKDSNGNTITFPSDKASSSKIAVGSIMNIADARTHAINDVVIVKGIITFIDGSNYYMQDGTAGIDLYKSGLTTLAVGDQVIAKGKIAAYNGLLEVSPVSTVDVIETSSGNVLPAPQTVTIDQVGEAYESERVKIEHVTLGTINTTGNTSITDTAGHSINIYKIPALTDIIAGDIVDVIAVPAEFTKSGLPVSFQLRVYQAADVTKADLGPDLIAPTIVHTPVTAGNTSADITINATITDDRKLGYESLYYRTTGTTDYTMLGMSAAGSNAYTAIIPKASLNTAGLEYYIEAGDGTNVSTSPANKSVPYQVSISADDITAPTITSMSPADGSATGDNKRPAIRADYSDDKLGVDSATVKLTLDNVDVTASAVISATGVTYTPTSDMIDGLHTVKLAVSDLIGNKAEKTWSFYVGKISYKNYFGQLHSHTTNSDGAGTLDEAYAWARDNAKLDFFAVTDHSNSFDTAPAADKAGTYNLGAYNKDNVKWQAGKKAAADAAVPGKFVSFYAYEMTWSGGPGHMNTFNTEGFVSRNNTELNNKTNDAGMRAYYALLKLHPESISQFNHPGVTFGNFSGFAYYDPVIDQRISLVEVGNGEGAIGSGGYFPSYEQYDMALDKGWHVAPTNNQDNHKAMWGNANTARTVVNTDDFTEAGIYKAMKEMRVYATEDANLDINYTLNGERLGTILDTVPATADFKVEARNKAGSNKIKSIAIITNSGVEAYKEEFGTTDATLDYAMEAPKAGYYYIRVVQEDGRIAVTAPVWLGKADSVGIGDLTASTSTPVTTEAMTLTTTVFNNEASTATLNSVKYQVKGGDVIAENTLNTDLAASSTFKHTQSFTPTVANKTTIVATVSIKVNGVDKTYTKEIVTNIKDISKLKFIGIDASHLNEYVAGNYKDGMKNFSTIAMQYGLRTVILNSSADLIAAASNSKYQMLILTPPTRRLDPASGITHKYYSDEEVAAVASFAKQGKPVIITGWGDIYENYPYVTPGLGNHMAAQQNKLLAAIGSTLRIADDEAKDDVTNGGTAPRLYLVDYNNKVSPLLDGLLEGQKFSQYGGTTIYAVNTDGTPAVTLPASVVPIINGHGTTYSSDNDSDGYGFADPATKIPRYGSSPDTGKGAGRTLLTASETVDHGNGVASQVIVSGGSFMSDFEIKNTSLDNAADAYSNEVIVRNLLSTIENIIVTPIADVKTATEGTEFTIDGIATVSVYDGKSDNNTGFFDSIYVQDATGGINLFPVSSNVQAGQRIRVTGEVSSYQGEMQLNVSSVKILDEAITPVTLTVVSTKDAMAAANTGKLIKTTGFVTRVVAEQNGTVNEITIDDGTGPAIIYINAYITPGKVLSFVTKGSTVSVIGLASIGENFTSTTAFLPRIRVRDRGEINSAEAITFAVRFDSDGGKTVAGVSGITPFTTIAIPAAPTKSGYTFGGWFTGKGGTGTALTAETVISSNTTFYANWFKNQSDDKNDKTGNTVVNQPAPAPTPAPAPASTTVVANIELKPELGANGVAKTTVSPNDMNALVQKAVAAATTIPAAVEIKAIAPANAQAASVVIPASAVQSIAGTNNTSITIDTGLTAITFNEQAVAAISNAGTNGNVELSVAVVEPTTLSKEVRTLVGTRPVYNFDITSDGKKVSSFNGGKAHLNIPYSLQAGEDAESVVLYHITSDGKLESVRCVYNTETKTIEAVLNHFSEYAVGYNKVNFKDVPSNAWYAKATSFIASRGITSGTGNGNFGPSEKLTREQFLVMLMKAYNIAPDTEAIKSFDDVSDTYAAPYISAAKRLGISAGVGGNKFNPTKEISRQEMFVMLYNALKAIGEQPTAKANLSIKGYKDLSDVADWALPAMTLIVESGLSSGTGNNKLSPLSVSDRATAAQIIYNLMK